MPQAPPFHANGIDAASGDYLLPGLAPGDLAKLARGEPLDAAVQKELAVRRAAAAAHFGLADGYDPNDLADTGWRIVVAADADPAIRDALAALGAHRKEAACSKSERRFRLLEGAQGYRPGLTKNAFLAANGAAPVEANPDKLPYYLLLVGGPEAIPFRFQYELDVIYSVGRVHFDTA